MKKEKIKVKKEQVGLLKEKLREIFLAGRKEGVKFGDFPSFMKDPNKKLQETLQESFSIE